MGVTSPVEAIAAMVIELHAREDAQARAEARNDWYVIVPGAKGMLGPVSEPQARQAVRDSLEAGYAPKMMRVTEDYQA